MWCTFHVQSSIFFLARLFSLLAKLLLAEHVFRLPDHVFRRSQQFEQLDQLPVNLQEGNLISFSEIRILPFMGLRFGSYDPKSITSF